MFNVEYFDRKTEERRIIPVLPLTGQFLLLTLLSFFSLQNPFLLSEFLKVNQKKNKIVNHISKDRFRYRVALDGIDTKSIEFLVDLFDSRR